MTDTIDKKEENKEAARFCQPGAYQTPETDAHPLRRDRKFANRVFNVLNYLGLGFVVNSALSLGITYNALPTEPAQRGIHFLKNRLKHVIVGWEKVKGAFGKNSAFAQLSPEMREVHIGESARSMAEILCMCIAGTIMLIPMKLMENHREWFVDKLDRWRNPDYYRYCEQKNIEPKPLEEKSGPKQTWGRLINARLIGMGSVIGIDAGFQLFNNARFQKKKWNLDTIEWGMGKDAFDKLPESLRESFIRFFSNKGVSIEGIQPQMQERLLQVVDAPPELVKHAGRLAKIRENIKMNPALEKAQSWSERRAVMEKLQAAAEPERAALLKTINHNPHFKESIERAVFSEQTRLLSKELSLTLVMAGIVYALSKTGAMSWALSKIGLKPKEAKEEGDALREGIALLPPVPDASETPSSPSKAEKYRRPRQRSHASPSYAQKISAEESAGNMQPML